MKTQWYKQLLSLVLALALLIPLLPLAAIPVNAWGELRLSYTIENGEVTITGSNEPTDGVITIPETIEGYPVTAIAKSAFFRKSTVHSVTIPSTVTKIGQDAFYYCESLESVYISDLSAWCKIAFDGSRATPMCYASNLYLNGELLTDLTIPEDITQLIDYTFYGCERLINVTVPETVSNVGYYSFSRCTNLSNVTLSEGLQRIEDRAFLGCTALEEIVIPESVTEIGAYAFSACGLTSFTVPESITEIGNGLFSDCTNLTTVNIHDGVNKIGWAAFTRCSSLTNVTIPDGLTQIQSGLFEGCISLTAITIPDTVTSIQTWAFEGCTRLTSVTIPEGVTEVWYGAFQDSGLRLVTFLGSAPEMANDIFENVTADVYYPSDDATWTEEMKQDYRGTLTWIGYDPETQSPGELSHVCYDNDEDDFCDRCGKDFRHECISEDGNAFCDICYRDVEHTCTDENDDWYCDLCYRFIEHACISKDGDFFCDICGNTIVVQDVLVGDVTGDGQINLGDVAKLYAYVRAFGLLMENELAAWDITGNGRINMGDVSSLYAQIKGSV